MIERFYLKEFLTFKELELNLQNGLIVFTGPSGSGKSILMDAILSSIALANCDASLCESTVDWNIDEEKHGVTSDEVNVFRQIRKDKTRYFVNNQSISRKSMQNIALEHVKHLSLKDFSDFENNNLLELLDKRIQKSEKGFHIIKYEFQNTYIEYTQLKKELDEILENEKDVQELIDFAKYEIEKIESIHPSVDEDVELLKIKKELSKKEKSMQKINAAQEIFAFEVHVGDALRSLEIDDTFFSDAMNELRSIMEGAQDRFSELDEVNIEEVLDRLEALSTLKRRYGSIQEAITYKQTKLEELHKLENLEFEKNDLQKRVQNFETQLFTLSDKITNFRQKHLLDFELDLNQYLSKLYLRNASLELKKIELSTNGQDEIHIALDGVRLQNISTGEFNRLRLSMLALKSEFLSQQGGVLVLDEIDANLSGEESMSVAKVLKYLANFFQVYVISHQPQLTSMGDQHFLVYKENGESKVKELDNIGKINEIARIISGNNISDEAKQFAKELLEGTKNIA